MGRAHTEPNLVPDKLAMGISLLFPQNIVISEPIPRWKRKREVWSITQPKTSHSELGRTWHNPGLAMSITSAPGGTSLEHSKVPSL